ncbi:hypothetical protein B0T16DRAFT_194762 [Cercophora newfieldiana]|uniref:Uncharacterized protein n=1 Tax=Cercophora newfieldiana TaxID=92897 RepID=A0AA39Y2K4_9PEZI|nr:hypothetical protein B0T16DRAFT_194762 [Cercophora newfieldiana]
MKISIISSVIATLTGLVTASPVTLASPMEFTPAAEGSPLCAPPFLQAAQYLSVLPLTSPSLTRQHRGTLKAWTGTGSNKCAGNPGYTWTSIGDGCIHFVGGDGKAKVVHRLLWEGSQACSIYAFRDTNCNAGSALQPTVPSTSMCYYSVAALSFKVLC